jgi:hypothetical protein
MNEIENKRILSIYKKSFLFLLIIITIYSSIVVSMHHNTRLTADSTLYLNIADKYISGDFKNAINGYWGPMLVWLLIPFLHLGASHVFAMNALNLFIGIFTIIGVWTLSLRYEITEKIRISILFSLLPIMLFYSVVEPFDFLLLCFLVFYLSIIFRDDYPQKLLYGILCGGLGALAYFTKSYAFPFFLSHFVAMNIIHYIRCKNREEKVKVFRNTATGLVIFLIIASPWIFLISSKYGHFTISNMGKGNFAAHAPGLPLSGFEVGGPMFHKGFLPPPNDTAISAWEDPSYIWENIESWSPFESIHNLKYFIKLSMKNIIDGILIFQSFSRLSVAIMIAYILIIIPHTLSKHILRPELFYTFFTFILFVGGYVPFHFEPRYLWLINILLLLMGGYLIALLFNDIFFKSNFRKNILVFFFVISFIITPLKSFLGAGSGNINMDMFSLAMELKNIEKVKGNIASNREWEHIPIHDSWHKTFRLAYWLDSKYYGQAKLNISEDALLNELQKYNIDYYFYWSEFNDAPSFLTNYREITQGKISGLKIFSLKESLQHHDY